MNGILLVLSWLGFCLCLAVDMFQQLEALTGTDFMKIILKLQYGYYLMPFRLVSLEPIVNSLKWTWNCMVAETLLLKFQWQLIWIRALVKLYVFQLPLNNRQDYMNMFCCMSWQIHWFANIFLGIFLIRCRFEYQEFETRNLSVQCLLYVTNLHDVSRN